jgi:hypothetical protein
MHGKFKMERKEKKDMSFEITKGYKQGRAVSFYDLFDAMENKSRTKVTKDEVVKMCESGQVTNATIQWWQGKAIVRLKSDNIPLEKLDKDGTVLGEAHRAIRNPNNHINQNTVAPRPRVISETDDTVTVDVLPSARVVGRISNKTKKANVSFAGYDYKNVTEQLQLSTQIDYSKLENIESLFDMIASDFHLENIDIYKKAVSKNLKLDKKIKSMSSGEIVAVQSSLATYLMNMVYEEIGKKYIKYYSKASTCSESAE